jgi:hypothetical protein
MLNIMYDLPDQENDNDLYLVNADAIEQGSDLDVLRQPRPAAKESA